MRLYICGDSTAASYPPQQAPLTGWGQTLGQLLPEVEIHNHAIAGRSTKRFLEEGRLRAVERDGLSAGDLMLIQFAHNDTNPAPERHTEPWTSFQDNLSVFVDTARAHGALPVLLTPICIRAYERGMLKPCHGVYPDAIRALAARTNVPLADVYSLSMERLNRMGEAAARDLYMNLAPGQYAAYPEGSEDDVHTQPAGARFYAELIAGELRRLDLLPPQF